MNPERLTRQAIRLAQREERKRGRDLTREEVLSLSVQTLEPWMRALVVVAGLAACGLAWLCQSKGAPAGIWVGFGIAGGVIVVLGLVGKKAYLEREVQKMSKDGAAKTTEAVLNALP